MAFVKTFRVTPGNFFILTDGYILPDRRHLEVASNLSSSAFDHSDIRGFGLLLTNRPMVRHGLCSLLT